MDKLLSTWRTSEVMNHTNFFKVKEKSRRQRIESDSEYDSEMDDFIDDSGGNVDISEEIRSIFGWVRKRTFPKAYSFPIIECC